MAGHSKWANIKHRKGRQDAKRGILFSKLARAITVAAKLGLPAPDPELVHDLLPLLRAQRVDFTTFFRALAAVAPYAAAVEGPHPAVAPARGVVVATPERGGARESRRERERDGG